MKIGVLGFQGAIEEHCAHIVSLGHEAIKVLYPEQLDTLDGIILPGGESTTIGLLLNRTGMMQPLKEKIQQGLPVWGTCAGMILLAKELENDKNIYFEAIDITVRRNAYGTQIDSFQANANIPDVSEKPIPIVFIRAPFITKVGEAVNILYQHEGNIVAAQQNNVLVTSFHPELTDDNSFHDYFCKICTLHRENR
ncbi:MAG: pyridoxal 5'-phosphate synthase glutaminase subunit PdxT [Odoribacter sp.]|nr:pyridoxal 5'-phosphate synthase glutaminase subunit PdxT [Odoribacter sp.]